MIGIGSQKKLIASETRGNENLVQSARMKKRAVTFFSSTNSDGTFNGRSIKHPNSRYHAASGVDPVLRYSSNGRLRITLMTLSKLRIHILPDRRVCFAGRMPQGIYLPRNSWMQYQIIKRMVLWYLPCLELQGNVYSLGNTCYTRKENKFLIMLLTSLKH